MARSVRGRGCNGHGCAGPGRGPACHNGEPHGVLLAAGYRSVVRRPCLFARPELTPRVCAGDRAGSVRTGATGSDAVC